MSLDFEKMVIEQIDIIEETKRILNDFRNYAEKTKTKESFEQYDEGIKHAMIAIESIINSVDDEEKNRLIYQKHGFLSPYIKRYVSLEMALKEIYGGD